MSLAVVVGGSTTFGPSVGSVERKGVAVWVRGVCKHGRQGRKRRVGPRTERCRGTTGRRPFSKDGTRTSEVPGWSRRPYVDTEGGVGCRHELGRG